MEMQQCIYARMNSQGNFIQLIHIRHQDDKWFFPMSSLDVKYLIDCFMMRRIAAKAPDRICGVQDDASPLKNLNCLFDDLLDLFSVQNNDK